ncbi:MAG: multidrug transporter [Chloroflexi bacterium HGW-Chloroflexi-3]|nr:MAG: multidrug transporter [Chloroflexi bacterium HGW-Chloroflexi-3]
MLDYRIVLRSNRQVLPFNEPARDLRILNKPLWLIQRDALAAYTNQEIDIYPEEKIPIENKSCIVFRDNLFFDETFIKSFIDLAMKKNCAMRAAFTIEDAAFREHCLPLSSSYEKKDNLYFADLWYYPNGPVDEVEPLVMDLQAQEIGYYHVPTYMAFNQGDLVYQVPLQSLIAIDSWVHVFIADAIFGLFARGARFELRLKNDPKFMLGVLFTSMYEGKQLLTCSKLVTVGKNCSIDPSAVIHGPSTIGDNVTIGAGVVIENCIIGNNVNISQGCNLMLSVIGDGTFLPFRASLFMTTLMDNSMVAQNTCLQMSVVGRNSFVGAGTTFTDFNLLPVDLRAKDANGELGSANRPVLGGCVGHNCRIGSGLVVFPARTIESDVVLISSNNRRVIDHDISYEESDHHKLKQSDLHRQFYPRENG